jgi:hypothetical protein
MKMALMFTHIQDVINCESSTVYRSLKPDVVSANKLDNILRLYSK